MKKIFLHSLAGIALISLTSCTTTITKLNTSGAYTYKINALGVSNDIQAEAANTAGNLCRTLNKDYQFIRNTVLPKSVMGIDLISYDLIFSCVDPGGAQPPPPEEETADKARENADAAAASRSDKEKLAAAEAGAGRDKPIGDTPGEPESLGEPGRSKTPEMEREEGVIIEEKIVE